MLNRRPNYEIVMRALSKGLTFEHDGTEWGFSEDNDLVCKARRLTLDGGGETEVWLKPLGEQSIGWFIRWCDTLSDDTIFTLAANSSLTDIQNRKG